jgi:hypothetical protein
MTARVTGCNGRSRSKLHIRGERAGIAKTNVLNHLSWTPPPLAGTMLFVRDRRTMPAFELGVK